MQHDRSNWRIALLCAGKGRTDRPKGERPLRAHMLHSARSSFSRPALRQPLRSRACVRARLQPVEQPPLRSAQPPRLQWTFGAGEGASCQQLGGEGWERWERWGRGRAVCLFLLGWASSPAATALCELCVIECRRKSPCESAWFEPVAGDMGDGAPSRLHAIGSRKMASP